MRRWICRDEEITGWIHGGRSRFEDEQGGGRSRGNRRSVKEGSSFCPNEVRPKPEPNSAVLAQELSRFATSPNLLKVRCIDRDFRRRFNRYQHHRNFRLENAPDGRWIFENICVVQSDRVPGPETKR